MEYLILFLTYIFHFVSFCKYFSYLVPLPEKRIFIFVPSIGNDLGFGISVIVSKVADRSLTDIEMFRRLKIEDIFAIRCIVLQYSIQIYINFADLMKIIISKSVYYRCI